MIVRAEDIGRSTVDGRRRSNNNVGRRSNAKVIDGIVGGFYLHNSA
jgi:hypothetical protein